MRGDDEQSGHLFSYLSPEQRVPADHPLRAIRRMTDAALRELRPALDALYARAGRPSVPPEQLLRALLLQVLYSIRSERMLIEQLEYNLLFRWFVGLAMDADLWVPTTFTKNRARLLEGEIAARFFDAVTRQADAAGLLSDEHFTVDGSLLQAWASHKSFRPKDTPPPDGGGSNPTVDFRGEARSNETHVSTTDPDARLARKAGQTSRLAYHAHVLLDNRHGLVRNVCATHATGTAEVEAAVLMVTATMRAGGTVGADKGYDQRPFVDAVRALGITPHVAAKASCGAIDGRTTRHAGYAVSQRKRKLVEQVFGWLKTVGGLRQVRHRGGRLVDWQVTFAAAAYNLVRLRTLTARPA